MSDLDELLNKLTVSDLSFLAQCLGMELEEVFAKLVAAESPKELTRPPEVTLALAERDV